MSFQRHIKRDLDSGKQQAHLISYQLDGVLNSFVIGSGEIQVDGQIDLNLVRNAILEESESNSDPIILGVCDIGLQ